MSDAIDRTKETSNDQPSLCWRCNGEGGFYENPCPHCGATNPNVDLEKALAETPKMKELALSEIEEAYEILAFHEGSAAPEFAGAHPTVRINGQDFERALAAIRFVKKELEK